MIARECSIHHAPIVAVPAQPISRCPNCHYMSRHLSFDHCPECGRRMQIEEPEPQWRCPSCDPDEQDLAEARPEE